MQITKLRQQVLVAIRELSRGANAMTVKDISEATGISEKRVSQAVHEFKQKDLIQDPNEDLLKNTKYKKLKEQGVLVLRVSKRGKQFLRDWKRV